MSVRRAQPVRVGYVATAQGLGCKANRRFRLASWSVQRLLETVSENLECLERTLRFNVVHGLFCFRISSDLIPFASHPVCTFDWRGHFQAEFRRLGAWTKRHRVRISMHPGQYTLINSPNPEVTERAIAELHYHCDLLDAMGLGAQSKVQIHVGGLYGDREHSRDTFCSRYERLDRGIQKRLVIENDDTRFGLADCLQIHRRVEVPVVFDTLHHERINAGETLREALTLSAATWHRSDGVPMVDYSSQHPARRPGTHAEHMDPAHFRRFLDATAGMELDLLLELRDKEQSALAAAQLLRSRPIH